jgi:histidinol-phosphate aminotransferase
MAPTASTAPWSTSTSNRPPLTFPRPLDRRALCGYDPGTVTLLRSNVDAMSAYQPGEQPPANARVIKLNTNENPYPPSPECARAVLAELGQDGARLRLYSDPVARELRAAAGEVHGFDPASVLHGNGSDELLALLIRAAVDPGEAVAFPEPTYVLYETLAQAHGARIERHVFARDFALPESLYASHAKLILLASPNSPSGNSHPEASLERLARACPRAIVVVDEAYAEFSDQNALALVRRQPNVVVLRTLSKSHSLAGMRVGLLFGAPELIAGVAKVKDSYNLDRLAIAAGAAALRDHAWMRRNVERIVSTRGRLIGALQALGLEVRPSQSNFVFARLHDAPLARRAYEQLKQRGVLVRHFATEKLGDGLRISVGTDAEIDTLLAELSTFLTR